MDSTIIEKSLRMFIKNKDLPDQAFRYMSEMIKEEPSKNAVELCDLIGDFITDGMCYSPDEAIKICESVIKFLIDNGLKVEFKDTILAEKLHAPVTLGKANNEESKDSIYLDPFLGLEKSEVNYNTFDKSWQEKKSKLAKPKDAIDKKFEEYKEAKKAAPQPFVMHEKNDKNRADIIIDNLSLIIGGKTLLENTTLRLTYGKKYGLVGRNGIGKTTLLNGISRKEIDKFPKYLHVLHVEQEIEGDDETVLNSLLSCDKERLTLLTEEETLLKEDDEASNTKKEKNAKRLHEIQVRLQQIDAGSAEGKASKILRGLGFSEADLERPTKEFSGGWRMRVALAKALFCEPDMLLLDEPTNHLDLDAVMWLEDYVNNLTITVIVVSHARDFINNTSTEIIHFFDQKLAYYRGNYDNFEKVRAEKLRVQKRAKAAQDSSMEHMQQFIDKFRANAKRASLVQSRIKRLQKIEIIDEIAEDPTCVFIFPNPEKLSPPVLRLDEATIGYTPQNPILKEANFYADLESRIAVVGPNGAGKTTLLKALVGELEVFDGFYYKHNRLRIGMFTQHHVDLLDLKLSALEQLMTMFPGLHSEVFRNHLGSFGISGNLALRPMYLLSGGQKSRVAFAIVTWLQPHIIIMDEPTNHLDVDAVNALIIALNNFEGGLIIVSHDQYFVSCVCKTIYVVRDHKVISFKGDFDDYRRFVAKQRKH